MIICVRQSKVAGWKVKLPLDDENEDYEISLIV